MLLTTNVLTYSSDISDTRMFFQERRLSIPDERRHFAFAGKSAKFGTN
jgi:hypothetical protein